MSEIANPNGTVEPWEFAGWGRANRITNLLGSTQGPSRPSHKSLLGVWRATAICGNDITSSVLYVSALCAAQAGALAPLVLLIVAGVLYLYRKVYAEVGSALPLNGGTYTVLLNTTNKRVAAAAACLTLLSYMATAVISASEAMHYAHNLWTGLDVFAATIGILGVFAFLGIIGISESAVVALGIFVFHIATLTLLTVACAFIVVRDPSMLVDNWHLPTTGSLPKALFFGFAAAMLGISGFESSANFIEEQEPGVFPKTLRNMWIAISIFNPLISLLSLGLLPLAEIQQVPPDLLARMGEVAVGRPLGLLVSTDAVLVLSGAVLTSFVGVTGLMRRMALDRCLPQFLLQENRWRGTNHWILLSFFGLCVSILLITEGRIDALAGVYTLAFLSVMALFAIGNMLLKTRRARLPRAVRAGWPTVTTALFAVLLGLVGNILLDPITLEIFEGYFAATAALVAVMFLRLEIMKVALYLSRSFVEKLNTASSWIYNAILGQMERVNQNAMVYFTKGDSLVTLNQAALYVLDNEQTSRLMVVHVYEDESQIPPDLADHLKLIDHLYPQLRIDFLAVKGVFGPELVEALSRRLRVPKNAMFIGTPGDRFPHRIDDLGGVRVIL
ncbi:MAG TPA: APC family permease [Deltaproteobacteria bacterium]|nr:APC family permease [Deltaproteobacteria bacterium]